MAALKAIARVPSAWCTGNQASGAPRQSRVDESAPLGRYRAIPEARMQLYPSPVIHVSDRIYGANPCSP